MKSARLWASITAGLAALSLIALLSPQFRIVVWDTGQKKLLYLWGGHTALQATVSPLVYLIAALWGLAGVSSLGIAAYRLHQSHRSAVAWMNWAAFFIAMHLIFLLVAAEEVLTDLRMAALHADSFAHIGSATNFAILFLLLFLPSRIKKWLFAS